MGTNTGVYMGALETSSKQQCNFSVNTQKRGDLLQIVVHYFGKMFTQQFYNPTNPYVPQVFLTISFVYLDLFPWNTTFESDSFKVLNKETTQFTSRITCVVHNHTSICKLCKS